MSMFFVEGHLRYQEGAWRDDNGDAVDIQPVRHGRWVDKMVRDWHCSECGKKASFDGYCYDDKPNYCPNCGAKMDGDKHDTQG